MKFKKNVLLMAIVLSTIFNGISANAAEIHISNVNGR